MSSFPIREFLSANQCSWCIGRDHIHRINYLQCLRWTFPWQPKVSKHFEDFMCENFFGFPFQFVKVLCESWNSRARLKVMKHQQVVPDYVVMLESSVTILALVACGWLLFKFVIPCFAMRIYWLRGFLWHDFYLDWCLHAFGFPNTWRISR